MSHSVANHDKWISFGIDIYNLDQIGSSSTTVVGLLFMAPIPTTGPMVWLSGKDCNLSLPCLQLSIHGYVFGYMLSENLYAYKLGCFSTLIKDQELLSAEMFCRHTKWWLAEFHVLVLVIGYGVAMCKWLTCVPYTVSDGQLIIAATIFEITNIDLTNEKPGIYFTLVESGNQA